jgi:hypothetical protein
MAWGLLVIVLRLNRSDNGTGEKMMLPWIAGFTLLGSGGAIGLADEHE